MRFLSRLSRPPFLIASSTREFLCPRFLEGANRWHDVHEIVRPRADHSSCTVRWQVDNARQMDNLGLLVCLPSWREAP